MFRVFTALAVTAVWIFAVVTFALGAARADSAGNIPGPGTCDYPGIGHWGMIGEGLMAEYYWWCDEPTEVNGSHRHCEYEGAAAQFQGGLTAFIFQLGLQAPVGGVFGGCTYRCPNNAQAKEEMPNPPSLWLQSGRGFNGTPCISVGDPLPLPAVPPGAPPPGAPPANTAGPVGAGPAVVP